ncbi:probable prolyl 4-hydroxylase 3 [Vigna unguiculata]|uniref:procollagen-proline 4-dioxygenase n=1 Tax=Vigna unguiculata TaxID=3917 RepID=A0A4D6NTE8_VIGUN|nr:probable prolyl 4-hydroxylase 3 [Vigna unguiculata]XP_027942459.1 probable prolyl 4-hydroxylase 3 [Vigna unguiculata]QCE16718.1 prolyl 4-hydroxylase [Vigna unguiculata]
MAKGKHVHTRAQGKKWSTFSLFLWMLFFLTLILVVLLALGIVYFPTTDDDFPTADLAAFRRKTSQSLEKNPEQWTEILSWEPRAFIYHNFLSKEECEYLIELAKPYMVKSSVVDSKTGKSTESRVRTSSGMFLKRGRDKVVQDIEKRIADFTFIPVENGEGLQILHYEVGQKYEPHYDYFLDEFNTKNGGQRIATVLMYLSDVEEGGETVFPAANANFSSVPWWNDLSQCARKGLSVKPKRGDALLFWSMRPDATLDPSSLHGGCPVIRGNKWSSTKWMHLREYKV